MPPYTKSYKTAKIHVEHGASALKVKYLPLSCEIRFEEVQVAYTEYYQTASY